MDFDYLKIRKFDQRTDGPSNIIIYCYYTKEMSVTIPNPKNLEKCDECYQKFTKGIFFLRKRMYLKLDDFLNENDLY
jgi:hypothetical protein